MFRQKFKQILSRLVPGGPARQVLFVPFLAIFPGAAHASTPLTVMPMGDSITYGVDYLTNSAGGYRDPLFQDLKAAGIAFTFVGANTGNPTNALTSAGQTSHNGYGSWHIKDLDNNLNGSVAPQYGGDPNQGGYFLTGGHGTGRAAVSPSLILLHAGTNDLLQGNANIDSDLYTLVTDIHALSPATVILIAGVIPINSSGFLAPVAAYNSYIKNQLVPSLSYTRYVDQNTGFLEANGTVNGNLLGADNVHPDRFGYPIMAQAWSSAIEAVEGVTPGGNTLTVNGGTGTGVYPAGTVLTLAANPAAAGLQFSSWMPATSVLSNPYSPLINFTMPSAATAVTANVAATGSPLVPNGTFQILSPYDGLAISAVSALGGAAIQQGTYTGAATQQWILTNLGGNNVSLTQPGTSLALEVPLSAANTLSASLDLALYTGSPNQQWQIALSKGNLQLTNVGSGQAITINGYSTAPGAPIQQFTASAYTDQMWNLFPISTSVSQYPLVVNGGSGGGMYAAGTTVAVAANAPATGYQFTAWTGGISNLANPSAASTTLVTQGVADTITATYGPIPTASVVVTSGSGTGSYAVGTAVSVTANAPASGYQFTAWTGSTSALTSASSATTTLTVPSGGASVTATYTAIATPVTTGTSLGVFSMLSESATSGNSLVLLYGQSTEGNRLTTYWSGAPAIRVLSEGNSQYELVETLGGRCFTTNGAAVTINSCTGSTGQLYTLVKQADGSYTVQSGLGTCLNAPASFTLVTAAACNASPGELWQFIGTTPLVLPTTATATTGIVNSSTVPAGYHLTFDDEFTSLSLSDVNGAGTKWYTHTVQCCLSDTSNPSTPTYMAGVSDGAGKDPYSLVSGGGLDIRLQKTNGAWYSGVIATVDGTGEGFSQKYGYFEMKAKLPNALGTWPAFWLLNAAHLNSSAPAGEIDVFEEYGQFPTYINTTLHDWSSSTTVGYAQDQVANTTAAYHVYGMLWTAATITFYFDGVAYYSLPTPAIMNQAYYPIIDLGLGGGWPTSQTPQSSDLLVQYMRVYSN